MDPSAETAALEAGGKGVLTWFVDRISSGRGTIPYSFVTAAEIRRLPADLGDSGIALNSWAARELSVSPGDAVTLAYRIPGPGVADGLRAQEAQFIVRSIVPIDPGDRTLMPDFPGL